MNFRKIRQSQINKSHASSNSVQGLTWAMLENNCSLVDKDTHSLHAPFATYTNRIHCYMYYLHVNNNTYTHFTSKDITKQFGKLENY